MAKPTGLIGFYHPHKPVRYTGELLDPMTGELFKPPPMTKQEFKRECDINNIIKEFQVSGQVTHINARAQQGQYLDLPSDLDYQNSIEVARQAELAFMSLPAKVRDRFGNDPAEFLNFMGNPENLEESYKLGLRVKPRSETPQAAAPAGDQAAGLVDPGKPSGQQA